MAALNDVFDPRFERRRAPRHGHAIPAPTQWRCEEVQLLEISSGGFRASASESIGVDALIKIEIPALGTKSARVKWSRGNVFGAEFLSPADLRLLFLGGPVERKPTWIERVAA
jgi:hypothetical protein